MNSIQLCLDKKAYRTKPEANETGSISNRIAENITNIDYDKIREFAENVGAMGHTWIPATFGNGKRNKSSFDQMQLFALDFDNGITWKEVYNRSRKYNIPVLFSYATFSSQNCDKFRVVFLNDVSIPDQRSANVIITALMTIFPECDNACKDVSHLYYGGKELIYFDDNIPEIDIESLIMNMGLYLKDTFGANNYGRELRKFSQNTGLAMDSCNTFAVSVYHDENDFIHENFSPNDIVYINRNGEKFSKGYTISFINSRGYAGKTGDKGYAKHKECRISLDTICKKCRLFNEFKSGESWLYHDQLAGLAMNLMSAESGRKWFLDSLKDNINRHPEYHTYQKKYDEFKDYYWNYFTNKGYSPMRCENYCPYHDTCPHALNIIGTVQTKRHEIIKLTNCDNKYISVEEAHNNLAESLETAVNTPDFCMRRHIIKSPLGSGKTHKTLEYIRDLEERFALAVPTNVLKNEIYSKAYNMGINIMAAPSLYEIKETLPSEIWSFIELMYNSSDYKRIKPYIQKVSQRYDIPQLREYLEDENTAKNWKYDFVTTHSKLLNAPHFFTN
ncbi:MAG: hypothetical protein LBR68_07655 [Lachnoclostridium sp.]|nr:hypothetical protein [Lachnoclostridium sp.]